jgi:hypothetical protein
MINFLLQYQAVIRECINGVASVLFLTLTAMITVFLWDTWVAKGPVPYTKWASLPGVPTACVLLWIFGAESYRTFNVWLTYVQGGHYVGAFGTGSVGSTIGYLLAGIVLNIGLLRAIYIFTPPDWRRVWIYASVGAAVLISIPTFLQT